MREDTRPEGREAVERQTVSGWCTEDTWACLNQVWNCARGSESSCDRSSAPLVYCSACAFVLSFAGATAMRLVRIGGTNGGVVEGQRRGKWDVQINFSADGGGWRAIFKPVLRM